MIQHPNPGQKTVTATQLNTAVPNKPPRRWRRRFLIAITLIVLLWLFSSWLVADQMTQRAGTIRPEPVPALNWGKFEPLQLKTNDGQELGGWYLPGQKDFPVVLLLHGNGGTRADCLAQAEWMAAAGYPVLLITLRAHGDSTGRRNDFGYSAQHDVVAAVDWLKHRGHDKPIVWGRSLGAAAALFASRELGHRVSGYVLECPYRDLKTAVRNRTRSHLPLPLSWVAYEGLALTAPLILGDVDRISPYYACDGIPGDVPVLLLAGGSDRKATPSESQALADRIGGKARVIVFDGAGHLEMRRTEPNRYREIGLQFLASRRAAE
jgi:pimeloyl-ACP methyl ester carboxylesterase